MDTFTRTSVAKLLIQTGFLDMYLQESLKLLSDAVLQASDDELVKKRNEYNGAKAFAVTLRYHIESLYVNNDMQAQADRVTP